MLRERKLDGKNLAIYSATNFGKFKNIFEQVIKLAAPMFASELRLLRKTKNENGVAIARNNRPIQPLNDRVIYSYWIHKVMFDNVKYVYGFFKNYLDAN